MMNDYDLRRLKHLIVTVAEYYARELKPAVVTMMAEDLKELTYDQAEKAFAQYRKKDKTYRFPMPAQLIEIANPRVDDDSIATEIAGKVFQSISKFGYTDGEAAKDFFGPIGWKAVERYGGWDYLCANVGKTISVTTFIAHIRDICLAHIKFERSAFDLDQIKIAAPNKQEKPLLVDGGDAKKTLNEMQINSLVEKMGNKTLV